MKNKKINIKKLIFYIGISLIAGAIGTLLGGSTNDFKLLNKPPLSPKPIVFPIVWTILYILMGISAYIISTKESTKSLNIFYLQLLINILWTPIFFRFKLYLLALLWLILLFITILIMFIKFKRIDKTAAYLQIPYLIWLIIATYLNTGIYLLN